MANYHDQALDNLKNKKDILETFEDQVASRNIRDEEALGNLAKNSQPWIKVGLP